MTKTKPRPTGRKRAAESPPDARSVARHASLEMSPDEFRALGHQLVDDIARFLGSLSARPVGPDTRPAAIREMLGGDRPVPARGAEPAALLRDVTSLLFDRSTFNGHPRFFGYITSSAAPLGALADLLAATVNPNVGAWQLSPVATEIERQSVRWIAEMLGVPSSAGGLLVSGGNMANIVCFIAAHRAMASRLRDGWDVRTAGVVAGPRLVLYASSETHTWVQKAADVCGLGTDAIRWVPVDDGYRMDPAALRRQITEDRAAGLTPFLVVGTAGSVSTGAIDPLPEIGAVCRAEKVWFHVDGAYGAPAVLAADVPAELRALSEGDSIAVDPHKWLYAPLEAGCALVRDAEMLHQAFSYHPPYYNFNDAVDDAPTNFHEWGPQNSRGFRALKVWLGIQQAGRDGLARMIADDIALARLLYERTAAHPDLDALTLGLSIATFRFVPPDLRALAAGASATDAERVESYLNALNTALLEDLQRGGEVYLSNAVLTRSPTGTPAGRFALRACIVNFRTTAADIQAIPGIVARAGHVVDARLRPAADVPRRRGGSARRRRVASPAG